MKKQISEGAMKNIHIMANEAKDLQSFTKEMVKKYDIKLNTGLKRWLKELYERANKESYIRFASESKIKYQPQLDEDESKVNQMYKDIIHGAGWSSDDYIFNAAHSPLNKNKRFELMLKLAKSGKLANSNSLTGKEQHLKDISQHALMSVKDVLKKYNKKKLENMNENWGNDYSMQKLYKTLESPGMPKLTIYQFIKTLLKSAPSFRHKSDQNTLIKLFKDYKKLPDAAIQTWRKPNWIKWVHQYNLAENINENFSSTDIANIKRVVQKSKKLLGLNKVFDKMGFYTDVVVLDSIPPHLKIKKKKNDKQTFVLVNKRYADDPLWTVGDISGGLMESINESKFKPNQVQKAVDLIKKRLIKKWKTKGGYENFGQAELKKLQDKFEDVSDYSDDMRKIRLILMAFDDWAMEYTGTNESVNEAKSGREIARKLDVKYGLPKSITNKIKRLKIVTAADLQRILPKSELKDGDIKMILHEPGSNESVKEYNKSDSPHIDKHNNEYKTIEKINKKVGKNETKFYDELENLHDKLGSHAKYMLFISSALRGYKIDMYHDTKIKNPAEAEEALYNLSK